MGTSSPYHAEEEGLTLAEDPSPGALWLDYLELSSIAGNLRTLSDGKGSLRLSFTLILGRDRLTQNQSGLQGP